MVSSFLWLYGGLLLKENMSTHNNSWSFLVLKEFVEWGIKGLVINLNKFKAPNSTCFHISSDKYI